jgi:hypothetical protein
VYDAYVVNETMVAYGINNRAQENYLQKLGFEIYPHTYSVSAFSIGTMSRVLNSSVDLSGKWRSGVSGDGVVQNLLKNFEYQTYGIFPIDYYFRGTVPTYDYSFPSQVSATRTLIEAILVGEFKFDVGFDKVSNEDYILEKRSIFSDQSVHPKFIYTHSKIPGHSQNSGVCLPNEVNLYMERLEKANIEMKNDLELITEMDPEAIIIVAGDHGPYLTKNCHSTGDDYDLSEITRLDIQDRFGTFLAIRWPSERYEPYDDIVVIQDLFPAIFAFMFSDTDLLDAKIEPISRERSLVSGASVNDGIIDGGVDDGKSLFIQVIDD